VRQVIQIQNETHPPPDHDRHYNYKTERQSKIMWRVKVSEMTFTYCYQTDERTVYIQELHICQFLIHTICQDEKPGTVEKLTVYFLNTCVSRILDYCH